MNIQKRMELDKKKQLEREKHNAIYKLYCGIGALALIEDCNLSKKTVNKFIHAMYEKNKKYINRQVGIEELAIDLTKNGIGVLNINIDENGDFYPQYEKYAENLEDAE